MNDKRLFKNEDEIIDMNFDDKYVDISYLCESLTIEYSACFKDIRDKLIMFINYNIAKNS